MKTIFNFKNTEQNNTTCIAGHHIYIMLCCMCFEEPGYEFTLYLQSYIPLPYFLTRFNNHNGFELILVLVVCMNEGFFVFCDVVTDR